MVQERVLESLGGSRAEIKVNRRRHGDQFTLSAEYNIKFIQ